MASAYFWLFLHPPPPCQHLDNPPPSLPFYLHGPLLILVGQRHAYFTSTGQEFRRICHLIQMMEIFFWFREETLNPAFHPINWDKKKHETCWNKWKKHFILFNELIQGIGSSVWPYLWIYGSEKIQNNSKFNRIPWNNIKNFLKRLAQPEKVSPSHVRLHKNFCIFHVRFFLVIGSL